MKITEIINEAGLASGAANAGRGMMGPLRTLAASTTRFKRFFTMIDRKRAAGLNRGIKASAKMANKMGPWLMVLRALGILTACYELWDDLADADQMYEDGEIDEAKLRDFRQFYIGVFTASVLVPKVATMLANSRYVAWIGKFLIRIISVGGATVTAGASIVALVASEAFFAWFIAWLNSEEAQHWLAEKLMLPMILLGKIPENAWSWMTDHYKKEDTKRIEKGHGTGASNNDAFGNVAPTVAPTLIGGVRVTDAEGYLLPSVELNPAVQAAIMNPNSAEAKKFAAIPKRASGSDTSAYDALNTPMSYNASTNQLVAPRK